MKLSQFISTYEDLVYSSIDDFRGISVNWYRTSSSYRCVLMTYNCLLSFDLCSSFRDIFLNNPYDSTLYEFSFSFFNLSNDIVCFECIMSEI